MPFTRGTISQVVSNQGQPEGLSNRETVVASGQVLEGVTPSGTYVSKVTFTVSNGVITAIALS